jgi:PAS domain S-box-containing protein
MDIHGVWYACRLIPLIENNAVRNVLVIAGDITERKRGERAFKESEERFRAIVDNAVDGVLLADVDSRKLTAGNQMICRMLGYDRQEIEKLTVMDIHPEEDLPYVLKQFEKQVTRELALAKSVPVRRKDGTVFYADINAFPITVSGKACLAGIFRDITERKQFERELSEITTREQQTIGRELHDGLGQQLLGLRLMARGLQESLDAKGLPEAESADELARALDDAQSNIRALIKGIQPVEVDAAGLMAALSDLANSTEQLAHIHCAFDSDRVIHLEDSHTATQLFYIAQEATRNAVKHADAKQITIGLGQDDRQLRLCVRDDGVGMPPGPDRSVGVGLRIMQYRAGILGAALTIENTNCGGTLVTCILPLEEVR